MDKISGILPSSSRISGVDLKEAPPTRPGAPGFGRPEGISTLKDSLGPQDTARRGIDAKADQMDWRHKDAHNSQIVQGITDGFFAKNKKNVGDGGPETRADESVTVKNAPIFQSPVASRPAGFTDSFKPSRSFSVEPEEETEFERSAAPTMPPLQQPEGFYPKGSFINRVA
jgi:hypothetical protein